MKKLLKNQDVYEMRHALAADIPEFIYIMENFEKGKGECEECDKKVYALSLYNYVIYALKSEDKDCVGRILSHFDHDFIIDGKRYTIEQVLEKEFIYKEKEMPSSTNIVIGFFKSIVGILFNSMKNGSMMSSVYERRKRLAICKSCASYDASCDKCSECGCPMKRKVKFKYAECPRGKW
jgi:hypothetical protein